MSRTIFIGDVHGCAQEFRELIARLDYRIGYDKLYLTGDSFARGPDPAGVFNLIQQTRAQSVLGNHDWKMLRYIEHLETGGHKGEKFGHAQKKSVKQMSELGGELKDYLSSLPLSINGLGWVLVHAGIDPVKGIEGSDMVTLLTARTYPGPNVEGAPKWYESYNGDTLIIFGHDAIPGLVRKEKNGRPIAMGLDSGCVYGGQLTAWILEEDRLVQVPAGKVYHEPVKEDLGYPEP